MALDWDSADPSPKNKVFGFKLCQIEEHLYLGVGCLSYEPKVLQSLNIKKILMIADSINNIPAPKVEGIQERRIVLEGSDSHKEMLTYLPNTCAIIRHCIKRGNSILVDSIGDSVRSTAVVVGYLMAKYEISLKGAQTLVATRRPLIAPIHGYERQLCLFATMGYKLDANNVYFRQYLAEMYANPKLANRYFERLSIAEKMTAQLPEGQAFVCNVCGFELFREIHVLCNDDQQRSEILNDAYGDRDRNWSCDKLYVEPRPWMLELVSGRDVSDFDGIIRCRQCSDPKARIELWMHKLGCGCVHHWGLPGLTIHMFDNKFKIKK